MNREIKRQHCFYPAPECLFNSGCLEGLANFLNAIRGERVGAADAP
jgi:hypothetical protein